MSRERDREVKALRDQLHGALASFHETRTAVLESLTEESRYSMTSDHPEADERAPESWAGAGH